MTVQFRLDDVECVGRVLEWVRFGPTGWEALGPDRPGRYPRRRDSSHVHAPALDDEPPRERPQIGA